MTANRFSPLVKPRSSPERFMFAIRRVSLSSARELGDGRHLSNAFVCYAALSSLPLDLRPSGSRSARHSRSPLSLFANAFGVAQLKLIRLPKLTHCYPRS